MLVSKSFMFSASHVLPNHPGKCSRLHGHNWDLKVMLYGPIKKESGFVADFYDLKKLVDEHIIDKLDHSHLGQGLAITVEPRLEQDDRKWEPYFGLDFYPSSENLVVAIARVLIPLVPELGHNVRLAQVELCETCTSAAYWINTDLFQNVLEIK